MEVTLEKVIGKSIIDTNFRAQLLEAPEQALQQMGWKLNSTELGKLRVGVSKLHTNNDQLFTETRGGWWS